MKKALLALILSLVIAGGAFADWWDSYAPGVDDATLFANAGIGIGFLPYTSYGILLLPVQVSAEYVLPINLPISVGGYFGIAMYKKEPSDFIKYTGTVMGFGARGSYHFNFDIMNLDTYASVTFGWLIWNQKDNDFKYPSYSTFFYNGNIGARYFFTNNIGAYLELGYSAISIASAGLALKF